MTTVLKALRHLVNSTFTFVKKILNSGDIYQQTACIDLCRKNQYLEKCNCILKDRDVWQCSNNNYNITCNNDLVDNFYSNIMLNVCLYVH